LAQELFRTHSDKQAIQNPDFRQLNALFLVDKNREKSTLKQTIIGFTKVPNPYLWREAPFAASGRLASRIQLSHSLRVGSSTLRMATLNSSRPAFT
jgi:hypothetical protein